ncbi:MAG: deoxyguanosinetriphosphate triphosphohydrolase [Clostridia bacterium]|nr:deoxyguanosinetriphosphate triphosphohydrolase [Clostridia bacterium]
MTPKEVSEKIENAILSPYAAKSSESKGRAVFEEESELRTVYQRDRDRIIHSKAFRRLKHKTQVFLSPESDHYRTRLTHTLEVSQIARTIARALRMNEDLTEAIALGHDLGHTPFGHAGERALNDLFGHFTHYEQSIRICNYLERGGEGLNLTYEVLDGIKNHTTGEWAKTAEGKIVRISDHIAYMNHDIEDAVRAGVISNDDIPKDIVEFLGNSKSKRIDTLVKSVVKNSHNGEILMDDETKKYYDKLHKFLFDAVYYNPVAKSEEAKVFGIVEGLYNYYIKHTDKLSTEYTKVLEVEGADRAVVDYISGMTDSFAISEYENFYIPKSWNIK